MHRRRLFLALPLFGLCAASAACSAILGLEEPPGEDGGAPSPPKDATTNDGTANDSPGADVPSGDDGGDGSTSSDGGVQPTCTPLAAGDGGATYSPLDQEPIDDAGTMTWELFDTAAVPGFNGKPDYIGGAFDGRYVYFAGQGRWVARYDTMGTGFASAGSWAIASLSVATGFAGAVFDGRYVYFVPGVTRGGGVDSVAVRYDPQGAGGFAATSSSWETFDLATLSADGGAYAAGFLGGVFDGRYVYFVPRNDGAPFGRVVRYDTLAALEAGAPEGGANDAGDAGDAGGDAGAAADGGADAGDAGDGGGDAGVPPTGFGDPAYWSSFDVSAVSPTAVGFAGGVLAAGAIYLAPYVNDAFDAAVNGGSSSIVARYAAAAPFGSSSSWSTFDTTRVSGYAQADFGGAFDGRYVYFVPRGSGVVSRYDTTSAFGTVSSWAAYDTTRVVTLEGGSAVSRGGAAFDGRFVYFIPSSSQGSVPVTRYDTWSTFTADCAWSAFDPGTLVGPDGGRPGGYAGAVFDGQYVYLVPTSTATGSIVFARFAAKSPPSMPALPHFYGSFL